VTDRGTYLLRAGVNFDLRKDYIMKTHQDGQLTGAEKQEIQAFGLDCRGVCAEWDDWFDSLSDIEKLEVLRKAKADYEARLHDR